MRNPVVRFFMFLGPGLVTGASDDDPSGIGTYAQAGASFGYATLWMAWLTFPLMAAVQYICAKVGLVTGRGLAGVLREHYPRPLLFPVVFVLLAANTINAGVDIGAVAAGMNLLIPKVPLLVFVPFVVVAILVLQIFGSYRLIARTFKWLTLALLAYIASAFFARPDALAVLKGTFIPTVRFDAGFLATLVALLGTTISPYLFFWQASQEVEEKKALTATSLETEGRHGRGAELRGLGREHRYALFQRGDVFHHPGDGGDSVDGRPEERADRRRRRRGAVAAGRRRGLAPADAGPGRRRLLSCADPDGVERYALCEAFGWKSGLDKKLAGAKRFYALIVGATVCGAIINYMGINPVTALFWTAVLNGFLAPPLLVVIMLVSNNKAVMGERVNSRSINVLGWATAAVMFAAAVGLVVTWGQG